MRAYLIAACVALCLCAPGMASAAPAQANPTDIENVLKTLKAPQTTEHPRFYKTDEGFFRYLAAPPGAHFAVGSSVAKASDPEAAAKEFLSYHGGAFGVVSPRGAYTTNRVKSDSGRNYVRLQQTYNGIDVFAAQMSIQLDSANGIVCVLSDILRDTTPLDNGNVNISPTLSIDAAAQKAIAWAAAEYRVNPSGLDTNIPDRVIFDPTVVGATGPVTVAWMVTVAGTSEKPVREKVFVDGHSGEVLFHYSLIMEARRRLIYDANNASLRLGTLVRSEGDPVCGIADADKAYDYLGDIYDFYYTVHGRDSIDGHGLNMQATTRFCDYYDYCPWPNAMWMPKEDADQLPDYYAPDHMYFGQGMVVDDIAAHEMTHGVTSYESNLIYAYQSGAINESFSDMWGEFVDMTNGKGTDTEAAKWLMGEDSPYGAGRSMKDPTEFGDPDRLRSPLYYNGTGDNGGVHINSGVINKLCYLLVQGDNFNGQSVTPLDTNFEESIKKGAKLFYEMQTNLLTPASDFYDFYYLLGQASVNLGYSFSERLNIQAAAKAVEIAPETDADRLKLFRAIPTYDLSGRPVIALYWKNPASTNFRQVILVRSTGGFVEDPSEGAEIFRGTAEKFLDTAVRLGTQYFYTIFVDLKTGFPTMMFAKATAGGTVADFLSEAFDGGTSLTSNPFDLNFSQILFSPTGPPEADLGESGSSDYSAYSVTLRRNVNKLPVAREDEDGAAYNLNLTDDGQVSAGLGTPFPFFGKLYRQIVLAANGYLTFERFYSYSDDNFPSMASHFSSPRISFLFSDLDPSGGGEVWLRSLDDRIAITFENVHEWQSYVYPPAYNPNTVQLELFISGHIRITWLGITAKDIVVGLSDGQGIPTDPALIFSNVRSVPISTDFTRYSYSPTALSIEPIAIQAVNAGELINFDVKTVVPSGLGTPTLTAEWDGPIGVPFVDYADGTGKFRWLTEVRDSGTYTLRIHAALGSLEAYQDVALWVGVTTALPVATDLRLRTDNPIEDPRRNRVIPPETSLTAEYTYSHPMALEQPSVFGEGNTLISWFRNNQMVASMSNVFTVPATYLRPGQTWFFTITPVTLGGLTGKTYQSPFVTVVALPQILNVALPADLPSNVQPEQLPLAGLPSAAGPSTGGTTVVLLGERLSNAISVTIGGIEVQSIHEVSDYWLEVVTPAHIPSLIVGGVPIAEDVVITTTNGTGILRNAFTFTDSGQPVDKADINLDGRVDAVDIQIVINTVLARCKSAADTDVNRDGRINAADIQAVINAALMQR